MTPESEYVTVVVDLEAVIGSVFCSIYVGGVLLAHINSDIPGMNATDSGSRERLIFFSSTKSRDALSAYKLSVYDRHSRIATIRKSFHKMHNDRLLGYVLF